jgi:hypothetical protein
MAIRHQQVSAEGAWRIESAFADWKLPPNLEGAWLRIPGSVAIIGEPAPFLWGGEQATWGGQPMTWGTL